MTSDYTCPICDTEGTSFSWTDTHGVGQCTTCGATVQLYFYDEGNPPRRIDRPPKSLVKKKWIERLREYWQQHKRRVPSGCSIPGGQELATPEEIRLFDHWLEKNGY